MNRLMYGDSGSFERVKSGWIFRFPQLINRIAFNLRGRSELQRNIVATRMYEGARQAAKLIQWRAKRFNAQLLWLNEADGLGSVGRIADIKVQTGTPLLVKGTEKRTNKRTSLRHTYIVTVKQCVFVATALKLIHLLRIQNI